MLWKEEGEEGLTTYLKRHDDAAAFNQKGRETLLTCFAIDNIVRIVVVRVSRNVLRNMTAVVVIVFFHHVHIAQET
jgi:hypothetical protein